jgi:acetyl esterase/lipase
LRYRATDATRSQPSIVEHARAPILTRAQIDVFLDLYLGLDGLAPDDPLVSPLWAASHADLAPALIQTADLDPLRDEGRLYGQRLAAAGVPARHTNYVGAPHGFASFPGATNIGRQHRGNWSASCAAICTPQGPQPPLDKGRTTALTAPWPGATHGWSTHPSTGPERSDEAT